MINKFHEGCYILTQNGYEKIKTLISEGNHFKVYTEEQTFMWAKAVLEPIDYYAKVSTNVLDNGFVNITTSDTTYKTAHDEKVAASGVLNRPLKSIHYLNRACNKYVISGVIASMFAYSSSKMDYYTRPSTNKWYRDDLFCLFGADAWDRCEEVIYLNQPGLSQDVYDVYGYLVSGKSPSLPQDIDNFTDYEATSLLRGILTVYVDFKTRNNLSFTFPTKELMNAVGKQLNRLGIGHTVKSRRTAAAFDPLNKDELFEYEHRLTLKTGQISKFMNMIGLVTPCAVDFVMQISRDVAIRAVEVTNLKYDPVTDKDKFYNIEVEKTNPNLAFFIIVGGVYIQVF